PAAGAGWHLDLVDKLAHAAWTIFQDIEKSGGAAAALARGLIQAAVMAARGRLERDIATRRLTLVGANDYASLSEAKVSVLDAAPSTLLPRPAAVEVSRLMPTRLAQPFEALRDVSDRMLAARGARPKIFLAGLGSQFNQRASFAKNFF